MFKKCKALFAALLAVVLVFGTVTVPAAATGTTVTINGQAYTSVYELRGTPPWYVQCRAAQRQPYF